MSSETMRFLKQSYRISSVAGCRNFDVASMRPDCDYLRRDREGVVRKARSPLFCKMISAEGALKKKIGAR